MGQTNQVRVFRFYMSDFVGEVGAVAAGVVEAVEAAGAVEAGVVEAGVVEAGAVEAGAGSISTLDHKCEEIQERKRLLCEGFLG
jgi:hypothetical protein